MDDANALADADNRGGIDRDGDDDGGLAWVYRRAASSARLVARLLVKNVLVVLILGGGMCRARVWVFVFCVLCGLLLAESKLVLRKRQYRTTFHSYVANTKRFANRNSLLLPPYYQLTHYLVR